MFIHILILSVLTFFFYTQSLTNLTRSLVMQLKWLQCLFSLGSGWTLVVTISSKNNDHLQGAEVHCFKPTLCVPFVEKNSDITAQKSGDEDIHEMMHFEDKSENVSIRVLLSTLCIHSAFYFCFCCKFKGRRLKVSMLIENLEVFGLLRFHCVWFLTFNLGSNFFFRSRFFFLESMFWQGMSLTPFFYQVLPTTCLSSIAVSC